MDDLNVLPEVLLVGISFFSPYLTAFFTKSNMSSKAKNWVAFGIAVVIAVGYTLLTGGITDWTDMSSLAVVFTIQQLAYRQILAKSVTKVEASIGVGKNEAPSEVVETKAPDGSEVLLATPDVDTQAKG